MRMLQARREEGLHASLNSQFELGAGCLTGGRLLLAVTTSGVASVELTGTQEGFSRGGGISVAAKTRALSWTQASACRCELWSLR